MHLLGTLQRPGLPDEVGVVHQHAFLWHLVTWGVLTQGSITGLWVGQTQPELECDSDVRRACRGSWRNSPAERQVGEGALPSASPCLLRAMVQNLSSVSAGQSVNATSGGTERAAEKRHLNFVQKGGQEPPGGGRQVFPSTWGGTGR